MKKWYINKLSMAVGIQGKLLVKLWITRDYDTF